MYTALNIASLALCAVYAVLCVLLSTHMFQLNSYKPKVQLKWMGKNKRRYIANALLLLIAVGAAFTNAVLLYALFFVAAVAASLCSLPLKKAKKPLVYTARVKRMLITDALVWLAAFAAAFFAGGERFALCAMSALLALTPFLALLGNLINSPLEGAIRRHYINDAKKMLRACPELKIIGITGSYGKTSVKYYLSTLLKGRYNVLMTPESYNTPMGVVKTVREQLRPTHEIFVCEMGARNVGDIKELCDIVHPDMGVITSIGEQHLESFKTIDNIIKTKFELYDAVSDKGNMFLNGDNESISSELKRRADAKSHTYGIKTGNEAYAYDIRVGAKGTEFSVCCAGKRIEGVRTPLVGEHNVVNLTGAIAVCAALGMTADDIKMQARKLEAPPHRLQLTRRGNIAVIDDAYNSNPAGCRAALETIKIIEEEKLIEKSVRTGENIKARLAEIKESLQLLGETRGAEAMELLKAWNTGHPGGICTIHANSATSALSRLETLILESNISGMTLPFIRSLIADAVNLVVHVQKDRRIGPVVSEVLEVSGLDIDGAYQTSVVEKRKD